MADGDEHAVRCQVAHRRCSNVAQPHAGDDLRLSAAQDILDHAVPHHRDFRVLEQPALQYLLGPQRAAAVHERDPLGEVAEVERLLDRGVAAADHHDRLAAVEEAVAGRAGRDAGALQPLLVGQAEPARLRAGGDHEGVGQVDIARVADAAERACAEVDRHDEVVRHLRADVLGLLGHLLHQPRTLDGALEAGIVLNVRGDHELTARLQPGDEHRLQAAAGGVDRGGVAGRPGADDQHAGGVCRCHPCHPSLAPPYRLARGPIKAIRRRSLATAAGCNIVAWRGRRLDLAA